MPDGRFLSKDIAHDWELNQRVSMEADYLFVRCIPHLDREGRMPGSPEEVKGIAVPLRSELTVEVVGRCLEELSEAELVEWYEVEGRPLLQFPGFDRHQKGLRKDREAESKFPSPKVHAAQPLTASLRTYSGPTPEDSGSTPAQVKVKGEVEVEVKEPPPTPPRPPANESGAESDPPAETGSGAGEDGEQERANELWAEIRQLAYERLGLRTLTPRQESTNRDVLTRWRYREERKPELVLAAIQGACMMRDRGEAWLKPGTGYTLAALINTDSVVEMPSEEGTVMRPLWQVAQERYYRAMDNDDGPRGKTTGGLERVDVSLGQQGAA